MDTSVPVSFFDCYNCKLTSSSAVAKKPRDVSCLSVVSFNSTKRRVESFIVSCVGCRFVTVQINALLCCLWHNCHAPDCQEVT